MKIRKLLAVLMLSVFCLSGCSNQYKDVIEQAQKAEQTTTVSEDKKDDPDKKSEEEESDETIPLPDMTEKWEIKDGGEQYADGTMILCDTYGFVNESGYQFACDVFLPKDVKDGDKCPVVVMNNGLQATWSMTDIVQLKPGAVPDENGEFKPEDMVSSGEKKAEISEMYASSRPESLLAEALNKEGIGLIVIEPFGSLTVYNTFLGAAKQSEEGFSTMGETKGHEFQNTYTVDKAYIDVVLDNLENIPGVDPSNVILASRDYHNIAATQCAAKDQQNLKGLLMIDPSTELIEKIRKENPEKGAIKGLDDAKAGMAMDYMYEIYDLDLKSESDKLNIDTKVFISKEKMQADTTNPKYDKGIVNGTLATEETAENCYPNCAPEVLDTTNFIYTSDPSEETKTSINKIVSYCNMLFSK